MNVNIASAIEACNQLGLAYKKIDKNGLFIEVALPGKKIHFIQNIVPLNSQIHTRICSDKEYTYLLLKETIHMPKTLGFLDPYVDEQFNSYVSEKNLKEISTIIQKEFSFPLILKRNRGSTGNNVFMCTDEAEIEKLIKIIFDKKSQNYDYIALAQEKINIKEEYRVIILNGKVQFAYVKDNSQATFVNNLSPLHWEGSKAILVEDDRIQALQKVVTTLYNKFEIAYAGLDIALDTNNELFLIEINSHPSFAYFVKDNGNKKVVQLYKHILQLSIDK